MQTSQEKKSYCYCRGPEVGAMINCDSCSEWFHDTCLGLSQQQFDEAAALPKYFCGGCLKKKRKRTSSTTRITQSMQSPKTPIKRKRRQSFWAPRKKRWTPRKAVLFPGIHQSKGIFSTALDSSSPKAAAFKAQYRRHQRRMALSAEGKATTKPVKRRLDFSSPPPGSMNPSIPIHPMDDPLPAQPLPSYTRPISRNILGSSTLIDPSSFHPSIHPSTAPEASLRSNPGNVEGGGSLSSSNQDQGQGRRSMNSNGGRLGLGLGSKLSRSSESAKRKIEAARSQAPPVLSRSLSRSLDSSRSHDSRVCSSRSHSPLLEDGDGSFFEFVID